VPLLLAAAVLLVRRFPAGPLLALPAALTTWYFTAELVLGPDRTGPAGNDEVFLPLFLGALVLSAAVALGAWPAVAAGSLPLGRRARACVGGMLLLVVVFFVVGRYVPAWLDVVRGTPSAEYTSGPGMWWTIAFEDLALLLPAAAATGWGLLRRATWAGAAAWAVSGCLALIGAAVAAMAWSMTLHGDPGASIGTAVAMTAIGLVAATPGVLCWVAVLRPGRHAAHGTAAHLAADREPIGTN